MYSSLLYHTPLYFHVFLIILYSLILFLFFLINLFLYIFYSVQISPFNLTLYFYSLNYFSYTKNFMDFGGLDDILDQDIGYIPTALKKQQKPIARPASLSRQNSTQSIGSMKDAKQDDFKPSMNSNRQYDSTIGVNKQSPKNSSFSIDQDLIRQPTRRNTLFGAHKQTANIVQNSNQSQGPISFQQFFKNQNNTNTIPSSKPPLPDSKPPLPQKKIQKNSSFSHLNSPQNIIDDDLNNSSVASRRGRPPLSRKNQNINNQSQIQQNRSQNFPTSKGFSNINQTASVSGQVLQKTNPEKHQQIVSNVMIPSFQNTQVPVINQALMDQSIEQLKKVFSNQIQYQKQAFESLIKQQRQSHKKQLQKLREFHEQEMKKKIEIKDFELQKVKQFYELQLKIHSERQLQIKEYNTINRKLEGNIQTIQKLQKNMKQNQLRNKKQKQDYFKQLLERKQNQLKQRETDLQSQLIQLQKQKQDLKNQKISLNQSINSQKARLYELQLDLRKRQAQLQMKYKKLQNKLNQEFQQKAKKIQQQRELLRLQSIQVQQKQNLLQIQKLQIINSRKLWDNQKKNYLQQLHQQKTKVLQKQIQIASRTGQIEIKQQQIQMHQNDYLNKLKLIQLQKKRIQIQKNNAKGQLYLTATSGALKTHGLLGTTLLNKTSQSALHKQFYSNQDYENQGFEDEPNYKKSISQMRDQFLKSLPKF